jgi:hypothetical protein
MARRYFQLRTAPPMYLCFLNTVSHFVQEVRPIDIRAWRALNSKPNLVSNHRALPRAKSLPPSFPVPQCRLVIPRLLNTKSASNIPKNAVSQRQQSKISNRGQCNEKENCFILLLLLLLLCSSSCVFSFFRNPDSKHR